MNNLSQHDKEFLKWLKQIKEEAIAERIKEDEMDKISIKLFGAPIDVLDEIFDYDEEIIQSALNKINAEYNKK